MHRIGICVQAREFLILLLVSLLHLPNHASYLNLKCSDILNIKCTASFNQDPSPWAIARHFNSSCIGIRVLFPTQWIYNDHKKSTQRTPYIFGNWISYNIHTLRWENRSRQQHLFHTAMRILNPPTIFTNCDLTRISTNSSMLRVTYNLQDGWYRHTHIPAPTDPQEDKDNSFQSSLPHIQLT